MSPMSCACLNLALQEQHADYHCPFPWLSYWQIQIKKFLCGSCSVSGNALTERCVMWCATIWQDKNLQPYAAWQPHSSHRPKAVADNNPCAPTVYETLNFCSFSHSRNIEGSQNFKKYVMWTRPRPFWPICILCIILTVRQLESKFEIYSFSHSRDIEGASKFHK